MLPDLSDLLAGRPDRLRVAGWVFAGAGAALLALTVLVEPYRRSLLKAVAFLAILLALLTWPRSALPDATARPTGVVEFLASAAGQLQTFMQWFVIVVGPIALAMSFAVDHLSARDRRDQARRCHPRRPWSP